MYLKFQNGMCTSHPNTVASYALFLETYLRGCGADQVEGLLKQQDALVSFYQIHRDCFEKASNSTKRREILKKHLQSLEFPAEGGLRIPFNPRYSVCFSKIISLVVKGLIIDECRVMDSAKAPLWLVFENYDTFGKPVRVMFKCKLSPRKH